MRERNTSSKHRNSSATRSKEGAKDSNCPRQIGCRSLAFPFEEPIVYVQGPLIPHLSTLQEFGICPGIFPLPGHQLGQEERRLSGPAALGSTELSSKSLRSRQSRLDAPDAVQLGRRKIQGPVHLESRKDLQPVLFQDTGQPVSLDLSFLYMEYWTDTKRCDDEMVVVIDRRRQ